MEHKAPDHRYERLTDAEERQKEELVKLMSECKGRIAECENATTLSENALSELQMQHDQAKDLITETFQSYKALLEKCRDGALDELEKYHSERELEVMDTFHRYAHCFHVYKNFAFTNIASLLLYLVVLSNCSVEKIVDRIENACRFTTRLLEHGDAVEILALRKVVGRQLHNLAKSILKPNVAHSIEFQTDYDLFQRTLQVTLQ